MSLDTHLCSVANGPASWSSSALGALVQRLVLRCLAPVCATIHIPLVLASLFTPSYPDASSSPAAASSLTLLPSYKSSPSWNSQPLRKLAVKNVPHPDADFPSDGSEVGTDGGRCDADCSALNCQMVGRSGLCLMLVL
ncbi:hypothetical protein FB451DRAFT_1415613 [Mycena latifolia]|nr:hypothetical protein FB451DRAFT_1415613 [Mycena latifolia]